jgi:hypothetical protein
MGLQKGSEDGGRKGGGEETVYTAVLSGLENKLVCSFKLVFPVFPFIIMVSTRICK